MKTIILLSLLSITYASLIPDLIGNISNGVSNTVENLLDVQRVTNEVTNGLTNVVGNLISGNVSKALLDLQQIVETVAFVVEEAAVETLDLPLGTGLAIDEYVSAYGYPLEKYEATTEDGYILELHRIPYGRNETSSNGTRTVVFLMHGIFGTSECFLFNGVNKSLGFLLADLGYDVWMGNARGTRYSMKHVRDDLTELEYYNFTLTEIGTYDIPASIDYILNQTNQQTLNYIGHSQGTTNFFVMGSEKPEYTEKIKRMIALAPVSYLNHAPNPFFQIAKYFLPELEAGLLLLRDYGIFVTSSVTDLLATLLCNDLSPVQDICQAAIYAFGGPDVPQQNKTLLPLFFTHYPKQTGMFVFVHFGQLVAADEFQKYDYGSEKNLIAYGQETPTVYNVSKINCPVHLLYGKADWVSSPIDVNRLAEQIPNVELYEVPFEGWAHFDFLIAKDVDVYVNEKVVQLLS